MKIINNTNMLKGMKTKLYYLLMTLLIGYCLCKGMWYQKQIRILKGMHKTEIQGNDKRA